MHESVFSATNAVQQRFPRSNRCEIRKVKITVVFVDIYRGEKHFEADRRAPHYGMQIRPDMARGPVGCFCQKKKKRGRKIRPALAKEGKKRNMKTEITTKKKWIAFDSLVPPGTFFAPSIASLRQGPLERTSAGVNE